MDKKQLYAMQLLEAAGSTQTAMRELQKVAELKRKTAKYMPKNNEVIVSITSVSKRYKLGKQTINALDGVSLEIYRGEFVAITGTSGSGKSTLLQLIGGLDKPTSGEVTVGSQKLSKLRDGKLSRFRNRTVGFIFQFFYLQPFLRLQTNLEVPAMFARTKAKLRHGKSSELAGTVGLADRIHHYPKELSGGQMQRAAIARALQNNPALLLADEPTGNLDQTNATAIFELFKKIRDEQGTTVVVVTHDLALASLADRVIQLSDGRIMLGGAE